MKVLRVKLLAKELYKYKFIIIFFIYVMSVIFLPIQSFGQTITTLSCTAPSATAAWPRNNFSSTCTLVLNRQSQTGIKVGVYAANYNTTRTAGTNGPSPINYTNQPVDTTYRFKADGPQQAGTPANITTNATVAAGITLVKSTINTNADANFTFNLIYTTYEADAGDTAYRQQYYVRVFKSNNTTAVTSAVQNYDFTIANKQYISTSTAPTISLASSSQVFNSGQYYDSNTFTVSVKANNTWALQTMLNPIPTSGSNTIPITSIYYKCATNAGFSCTASSRSQMAAANTYYQIASNNTATYVTTGSADGISLSSKDISVTYSLYNSSIFKKGSYLSTQTMNVHSPNP